MKTSIVLSAVLGLPFLASAAICNNNCGRAVAGTARRDPPLTARRSQCEALVSSTVTVNPGAATATVGPVNPRNVHMPRQAGSAPVLTGTVPAYASACADITAYWSACQCISGVVATTRTITSTTTIIDSVSSSTIITTSPFSTPTSSNTTSTGSSSSTLTFTNTTSSVSTGSTCTPTPILPNPTPLITSGDDESTSTTLPFPIGVFGSFDTNVYVSINGRVSLNPETRQYTNAPLPDTQIPSISVLAFYDDLIIQPGTSQGVAYQVFGSDNGSRTVIFEWVAAHYEFANQFYHFTSTFEEALPGIVTFRYYTTRDKGSNATVGAQNLVGSQSFVQYSFNSPGSIQDRTFVRLDTTGTGTFTTGDFNTSQC
ncbi:peptidase s8 and s53 subtilisin kexin sedolisin [Colletotrichum incanum]|uniref:Peptidase s8 and s53 subtilisin kexin sedolisin n=1 Tax=Colletotrichum incanum TaxID=1573173 RepID=A0A167CTU8_COLIC|nr:peptidase s8 and s53 subtilisin kexin sedolisin [Colletotrichum incanum]